MKVEELRKEILDLIETIEGGIESYTEVVGYYGWQPMYEIVVKEFTEEESEALDLLDSALKALNEGNVRKAQELYDEAYKVYYGINDFDLPETKEYGSIDDIEF